MHSVTADLLHSVGDPPYCLGLAATAPHCPPPPADGHTLLHCGRGVMLQLGRLEQKSVYGAHGVVESHPLRMRKALGSNPSVSRELQRVPEAPQAPVAKLPLPMAVPSHWHCLASDLQH